MNKKMICMLYLVVFLFVVVLPNYAIQNNYQSLLDGQLTTGSDDSLDLSSGSNFNMGAIMLQVLFYAIMITIISMTAVNLIQAWKEQGWIVFLGGKMIMVVAEVIVLIILPKILLGFSGSYIFFL